MQKTDAIILAAGKGTRVGSKTPKAYVKLDKKHLFYYSLKEFESHPEIDRIVLVVPESRINLTQRLIKEYNFKKVKTITQGGKERADSVKKGLDCLDKRSRLVLIHDSARPFVNSRLIYKIIRSLEKYKAVIPGILVKDTLKYTDKGLFVIKTIPKGHLYRIQTPQGFRTGLLKEKIKNIMHSQQVYDDSLLVESSTRVKIIESESMNFKITTREDLIIARKLLKR